MTDNQTGDNDAKKSKRVRKKRLYATIMNQMEFYFSNSNLTRDKYLRALVEKDKFISLSEFLKFDKIKSLSVDSEDLVHALSASQFLQLSTDGSAVCRRSPFVLKEDAELCTIYVENIPRASGAEALRRTFSAYGTIDYVSVPTHRATGQHRGFGFVEFRTPNMAHNALHAFGALGRRMPSEHYPEYLTSVDAELDCPAAGRDGEEMDGTGAGPGDLPPITAGQADLASRPGKRKLSTDSSSRDAPMKMTRFADTSGGVNADASAGSHTAPPDGSASATPADTENSNLSEWPADGTTSCSEPHREDASMGTSLLTEQTDDTDLSGGERQGRRRRRTRRGRKAPLLETEDTSLLGIQIMPLSEWSRFREQYRALQKENMSEIKRGLREEAVGRPPAVAADTPSRSAGVPPQFVPGTVVRFIPARVAGTTDKQLIETLKRRPGVRYVELCGGDADTAYLRLESPAAATACLAAADLKEPVLLTSGEEENYWRRLLEERERTRSRQRHNKERGRDRLLRRLKVKDGLGP